MKRKKRKRQGWFWKVWCSCFIVTVLFVTGAWSVYLLQDARMGEQKRETPASAKEARALEGRGMKESATDGSVTDESVTDESVTDESATDEIITDEGVVGKGAADRSDTAGAGAVDENDLEAERKLSGMTIEQKVAQMFFVTPDALTGYEAVEAAGETTKKALEKYPVGGLVYFAENLKNPQQTTEMLQNVQLYANEIEGLPLFLSVDEEGGSVARIGNNEGFSVEKIPDMAQIGASGDSVMAYQAGDTIGAYLSSYGFNLDFAPDADVLTEPQNQVVKKRSFGADAQLVTDMALQFAAGLNAHGVLACFKHFPGHGATKGDTHEGFAYTDKTLEELYERELVPFRAAVKEKIPFIMVSHISVPQVVGNNTPASLSDVIVTDILRQEMGYEGIIITDALGMGAITERYGTDEAAVRAIKAGVDMVLMSGDFVTAYQRVLKAVADGEITEERIDVSVKRILSEKYRLRRS